MLAQQDDEIWVTRSVGVALLVVPRHANRRVEVCSCDSLSRSWRAFANTPSSPVHPAAVRVNVPAAFRLRTRPRSGRALKRLRMQPFLRCSDTRANRGIFSKTPHYFRVIGVFDLRKRYVTPIRRLRGNRRSGVFSSSGVRYNPNRCESNLLVLSVSDFPHRACSMP